jgi:hypothetical protein
MLSDQTAIFIIDASQTSSAPPVTPTTNTAYVPYNGCGLPPLDDYTYTGYQAPCTVTSSGRVETLYPNVPASISALWSLSQTPVTTSKTSTTPSTTSTIAAPTTSVNTAFATGVFAQDLQCPSPIIPSKTSIIFSGTTTVLSLVACSAAVTQSSSGSNSVGVCHTSGYKTFSVSGTSSVCCPSGWATTPLNSELFCFTSAVGPNSKRNLVHARQVSASTCKSALSPTVFA